MRIGFGKRKITPWAGVPCSLGVDNELEQVFDDSWIRTMVLQHDDAMVIFMAADLIGFFWGEHADVARSVKLKCGLSDVQLVLHPTHTHLSPNVRWSGFARVNAEGLNAVSREYYDYFLDQAACSAVDALRDLEPCELFYGEAPVKNIQSCRRVPDGNGGIIMRYSRPSEELRRLPEGHIDPLARIVKFKRRGKDIVWINHNGHPTATGGDCAPFSTADYPGQAIRLLETQLENCEFLYMTGPHGDLNPGKYVSDASGELTSRVRDRDAMGSRLAASVVDAMKNMSRLESKELGFRRETLLLPRKEDYPTTLQAEVQYKDGIRRVLDAHAKGERMRGGGVVERVIFNLVILENCVQDKVPAVVSSLKIGELNVMFYPGEIFLKASDMLHQAFPGGPILAASLCDGLFSYVPTPDVWDTGGYELTATATGRQAFDVIADTALKQIRQMKNA